MKSLEYFDKYVSKGLKPIAIYKNSKRPVGNEWNQNWSIEKWRPFFLDEEYNMGIILGDIIDVEGDCPESCDLLERMIDGVKRPKFRSSKSVHNLFQTPDPELTRLVFNGIEFRGNLHQSVVPPSFHSDGCKYSFLHDTEWPVPPMPDELRDYYFKNKSERTIVKKQVAKVSRGPRPRKRINFEFKKTVCKICSNSYYIHEKRLILEVKAFREFNLQWMCHGCREIDMRDACRRIRKQIERFIPYVETNASILEGIEKCLLRR